MIGNWRGRQVEEQKAQEFNNALVDRLHKTYTGDIKDAGSKKEEYVNLFSPTFKKDNPTVADALKLLTPETRNKIISTFGARNSWFARTC